MRQFLLVALHYLKRACRDVKEILILLAIPIGIIILNSAITSGIEGVEFNGYNVFASHIAPPMLLSFQFFNGFFMFGFLYADFRSGHRWRLLAAPCRLRDFVFPAFIANWILSVGMGVVIIAVCALFLNVYWGNLFVLAVVLALVSLMATFAAVLIFLFTKKIGQANGVGYALSFGMMALSGFMIPLQIFGDNVVVRFLTTYGTPLSIGASAIISSGDLYGFFDGANVFFPGVIAGVEQPLMNIAILAAITFLTGVITVIAARRREI